MIEKPDKKSKDYVSATIGVPVTLGHRQCLPRATFPGVPMRMGWLWTARNVPAFRFDPAWRPGAVLRGTFHYRSPKKQTRHGAKSSSKTSKSKTSVVAPSELEPKASRKSVRKASNKSMLGKNKKMSAPSSIFEMSTSEEEDEPIKPMFYLQRREGNLRMTMQQVKNARNRIKTDLPYDESIPPFVVNISDEDVPRERGEQMKRKKLKKQKLQRRILFEQAIDSICRQLYENLDKAMIIEEATLSNKCPCSCIQEYVLKYLSKVFGNMKDENRNTKRTNRNILETIILDEGLLRTEAAPIVISSDDEWTVEFTPVCAKYEPVLTETQTKDVEVQTRTFDPTGGLLSKSAMSVKPL